MAKADLMAELLCNQQPHQIRVKLLNNKEFITRYNLRSSAIITIGGKIHINQNELLRAVRHVLEKEGSAKISDFDGKKHFVRIDQGHIHLESKSKELEVLLDDFFILSPKHKLIKN